MNIPLMSRYFDELAVGQKEMTRGRTITETDIVQWCAFTGDGFVLHTDKEYAAKSQFGQRIAPGIMIYAYSGGLAVPPVPRSIIANYGTDGLRYPAPTYIGDTIHVNQEVVELRDRDGTTGIAGVQWNAVTQESRLVMTCTVRVLLAKSNHPDLGVMAHES